MIWFVELGSVRLYNFYKLVNEVLCLIPLKVSVLILVELAPHLVNRLIELGFVIGQIVRKRRFVPSKRLQFRLWRRREGLLMRILRIRSSDFLTILVVHLILFRGYEFVQIIRLSLSLSKVHWLPRLNGTLV